jgi:hypothetical protein
MLSSETLWEMDDLAVAGAPSINRGGGAHQRAVSLIASMIF